MIQPPQTTSHRSPPRNLYLNQKAYMSIKLFLFKIYNMIVNNPTNKELLGAMKKFWDLSTK